MCRFEVYIAEIGNERRLALGYWDNICEMQRKQTEKGLATYGMALEQNADLSIEERITMAEEEMIDFLMYCEHIKTVLKTEQPMKK